MHRIKHLVALHGDLYSWKMRASKYFKVLLGNLRSYKPLGFRWCSTGGANGYPFYDVIIVGGGMVGSTLACALGKLNYGNPSSVETITIWWYMRVRFVLE